MIKHYYLSELHVVEIQLPGTAQQQKLQIRSVEISPAMQKYSVTSKMSRIQNVLSQSSTKALVLKCTYSTKSSGEKSTQMFYLSKSINAAIQKYSVKLKSRIKKKLSANILQSGIMRTFTLGTLSMFSCQYFYNLTRVNFEYQTFTCNRVFLQCSIGSCAHK